MSDLENLQSRLKSFKSLTKGARYCFLLVVFLAVMIETFHQFGARVGIEDVGQQVTQLLILFAVLIFIGEMGGTYIASKTRDMHGAKLK